MYVANLAHRSFNKTETSKSTFIIHNQSEIKKMEKRTREKLAEITLKKGEGLNENLYINNIKCTIKAIIKMTN